MAAPAASALARLCASSCHGDAGVREAHGDAATHDPRTDHRGAGDLAYGRIGGKSGHACDLALDRERVALRLRLRPVQQPHADLVLAPHPFGKGQLVGHAHRVHRVDGRQETALLLRQRPGEFFEHARLVQHRHDFTGAPQCPALSKDALGKGDCACLEVALDDLVDEPELECLGGPEILALGDHRERCTGTDQPRQALRAGSPGDDAELHLRQAQAGVRLRDAEVARRAQARGRRPMRCRASPRSQASR